MHKPYDCHLTNEEFIVRVKAYKGEKYNSTSRNIGYTAQDMMIVTLRQGLKPHGFFCHSFVRDTLRSGAWLRLGAHRNGGGIARKQRLHSGVLSPGRCHARSCFHADAAKGRMAHNLRFRRPGNQEHPHLSMLLPWERTHRGGGFS